MTDLEGRLCLECIEQSPGAARLATRSSGSPVKGFPIYQRARARGRYPSEEWIGYPTRHRTNRRTFGTRVMTLTLGGRRRSEGQALHTSSDVIIVMGRYRFPRTRLSRWLEPTNTQSSTRQLESNSQFVRHRIRFTGNLSAHQSTRVHKTKHFYQRAPTRGAPVLILV